MTDNILLVNNETGLSSNITVRCNSSIETVYCGVFENRQINFVALPISAILILLSTLQLLGMIWFERFHSGNYRTLMNKLFASVCWAAIAHNVHTVLDIFRYLLGPRPPSLCFLQNFFKFTATSVFLLLYDAIIITKYMLIFWLKNPGAVNDEFWCRFISLWVCFASTLYDGSRLILPGRLNTTYFICSGISPPSEFEEPIRGRASVEIFTVVLYTAIMIRLLIHKKGTFGVPVRHSAVSRFWVEDLVNLEKSTIATASVNFVIVFCFALYIYFYGRINTVHHHEYNFFPYNAVITFHILIFTPLMVFYACTIYYIRHLPLRQTLIREIKNQLPPALSNSFLFGGDL